MIRAQLDELGIPFSSGRGAVNATNAERTAETSEMLHSGKEPSMSATAVTSEERKALYQIFSETYSGNPNDQ